MSTPLTPLHFPRNADGSVHYTPQGDRQWVGSWPEYTTDCGRFSVSNDRLYREWRLHSEPDERGAGVIWDTWLDYVGLAQMHTTFRTRTAALSALEQALIVDGLLYKDNPASVVPDGHLQWLIDDDWFPTVAAIKAV